MCEERVRERARSENKIRDRKSLRVIYNTHTMWIKKLIHRSGLGWMREVVTFVLIRYSLEIES